MTTRMSCNKKKQEELIDYQSITIHLGLFYALKFGKSVQCTFIFIFVVLFLGFYLYTAPSITNNF